MPTRGVTLFMFAFAALPAWGYQDPPCDAPAMSNEQVKAIIVKARSERKDLPVAFPDYRWVVQRRGCYYTYIEYAKPETPDQNHIFKLNQHGVIVDVEPEQQRCPEKVFTEAELAQIVRNERAKRKDLPPPFAKAVTRVDRVRCLYLYFEYADPPAKGNYQVFTIDPLGGVMDVIRPDPR
jgi:hypothetical protein